MDISYDTLKEYIFHKKIIANFIFDFYLEQNKFKGVEYFVDVFKMSCRHSNQYIATRLYIEFGNSIISVCDYNMFNDIISNNCYNIYYWLFPICKSQYMIYFLKEQTTYNYIYNNVDFRFVTYTFSRTKVNISDMENNLHYDSTDLLDFNKRQLRMFTYFHYIEPTFVHQFIKNNSNIAIIISQYNYLLLEYILKFVNITHFHKLQNTYVVSFETEKQKMNECLIKHGLSSEDVEYVPAVVS
jgi:hypothetical protein